MAVQIKLFYNIAFDKDKCQVILLNAESFPTTYEELLERARERVEVLRFIPNSELCSSTSEIHKSNDLLSLAFSNNWV